MAPNLRLKICVNFIQAFKSNTTQDEYIRKFSQGPNDFTRDRTLTFSQMNLFLMGLNTTSLNRELRRFFEDNELNDGIPVSKSAFSQARKKLKHECFVDLNQRFTKLYYQEKQAVKTWRGKRLLSIDGTTLHLPRTESVKGYFGEWKPKNGEPRQMGRVSVLYDYLNDITLDAVLAPKQSGERVLAYHQTQSNVMKNDLLLLDRGYPCFWLLTGIVDKGADFVCRVEANKWTFSKELVNSEKEECIVTLEPSYLSRKKLEEHDIAVDHLELRTVKIKLSSGEIEVLLTSLKSSQVSLETLNELYQLRWPIEEKIKVYKCRAEVEKFSGKSYESVLQDFYAKILSTNLNALLCQASNERALHIYKNRRHKYKVNVNESLAIVKRKFIQAFLTPKYEKKILSLIYEISGYVEIIRPGRSNSRKKSNKIKKWSLCYQPIS